MEICSDLGFTWLTGTQFALPRVLVA
ncbi:uncharacterized protein G2W53_034316 [Senna tora]|uniref:Uncharacterized protein n=1 Tax=Senna tora TaxID=362788 RepID=A0A834T0B2_9FABA|nr:uncharacterized protein G2W53_034316 [Senna tora]